MIPELRTHKKRSRWKYVAVIIVAVFPLISLTKYAAYELSGAAPKLREAIGKQVEMPKTGLDYKMDWETGTPQTHKGELKSVKYGWNDEIGFFDLKATVGSLSTSLSPFEALDVKVLNKRESSQTPEKALPQNKDQG